jgi:hypothetical protein
MHVTLKGEFWISIILFIIVLSGCGTSKSEVLNNLVSKEKAKLVMAVFGDTGPEGFQFKVNGIYNSSDFLRQNVPPENYKTYVAKDELKWLEKLDIEEKAPVILVLDSEKIIFQTKEPEKLMEFAKRMEKK